MTRGVRGGRCLFAKWSEAKHKRFQQTGGRELLGGGEGGEGRGEYCQEGTAKRREVGQRTRPQPATNTNKSTVLQQKSRYKSKASDPEQIAGTTTCCRSVDYAGGLALSPLSDSRRTPSQRVAVPPVPHPAAPPPAAPAGPSRAGRISARYRSPCPPVAEAWRKRRRLSMREPARVATREVQQRRARESTVRVRDKREGMAAGTWKGSRPRAIVGVRAHALALRWE